jgi:nitrogen fixation protein FixH
VKKLIYGLYALFLILIVITFYMANKSYDGLVEERYYDKSKKYFETKKIEEDLGLTVNFDRDMKIGKNIFQVSISKKDGHLRGAKTILFVGNIASEKYDRKYPLREDAPGIYKAAVDIPAKGKWLFRLDIENNEIVTDRRWTVVIE